MRRLSIELGIDVRELPTTDAPDYGMSAVIDAALESTNLGDPREVQKAYRRLWHHASKGGRKSMLAFKKEWHEKLMTVRPPR